MSTQGKMYEFFRYTIADTACVLPPAIYTTAGGPYATGAISGYLSMQRYEKATFLVQGGVCATGDGAVPTLDVDVLESIGGVPGGDVLKSMALETCGDDCGDNDLWVFEVDADELNRTGGYTHLELLVTVGGALAKWPLSIVAIRGQRDKSPVPLGTVQQVID